MEENSNYYRNYTPILRSLDEVMRTKMFDIRHTPTTWNTILPQESYSEDFSWSATSAPVGVSSSAGNFKEMNDMESKDTPTITFSMDAEQIIFYNMESSLIASIEQIEHFQYWMRNGGYGNSDLVNQLVKAAKSAYQTNHDQVFLFGDNKKTKGLLNHPDLTDVTAEFTDETSILDLFSKLFMKMRTLTKGVSHAQKIIVSPDMYSLLLKYYDSSDKSDLEKLMKMPVDTVGGVAITPNLYVLDKLSPDPEEKEKKPYGDIYILSGNSDDFIYYYKPLLIRPFRELMLRSFGASMKFKYSQPYLVTKHSLLKCTPNPKIGAGE